MQLSASFCRTQQAFHHDRATRAILENVKLVAGKAAIAWGVEAQAAESREARRDRIGSGAEAAAPEQDFEDEDSPMFSENPDRDLTV